MANVIKMETASAIWGAHREIEAATKLLDELKERKRTGVEPTPHDAFGRPKNFQLGIPSGDNGHRLYDVNPDLCLYIIEAHLADKITELAHACGRARMELDGVLAAETPKTP